MSSSRHARYSSWVLIVFMQISSAASLQASQSPHREVKSINARDIDFVSVQLPQGVNLTWQAVKSTKNVSVEYTSDLTAVFTYDKNGQIQLTVELLNKNTASTRTNTPVVIVIGLLLAWAKAGGGKWNAVLFLAAMFIFGDGYAEPNTAGQEKMALKVNVPYAIEGLCVNKDCAPVLCKLSDNSVYSSLPSNHPLFIDKACNFQQPERWVEWTTFYFGQVTNETYYTDPDNDGLVNILEYYAMSAFSLKDNGTTNLNQTGSGKKRRSALKPVGEIGSNPTKIDTDGDLLKDGFEASNGLNPRVQNMISADYDNDGLDNLKEQIYRTDPYNADSDGDGISDGSEASQGADPIDSNDDGKAPSGPTAQVQLTVGDHSGSHSERYTLRVGTISHQAPGYGLVGSGVYTFRTGSYIITLQHDGTNLREPDYDYTALVRKTGGDANVTIEDKTGMLGVHDESDPFYAAGKSAKMTVSCPGATGRLGNAESCDCEQHLSCTDCTSSDQCTWDYSAKKCVKKTSGSKPYYFGTRYLHGTCWIGKRRRHADVPHVCTYKLVHRFIYYDGVYFEWGIKVNGVETGVFGDHPSDEISCKAELESLPAGYSSVDVGCIKACTMAYRAHYGDYGLLSNNCHDFANRLSAILHTNRCCPNWCKYNG